MQSFHHGLLGAKNAEIVVKKSGIDKSFLVRMVANSHGKERHILTLLETNVVRHFLIPFNLRLESTFTEDLEIVVKRLVKSFPGCKIPIKKEIKTEDVLNDLVQKVDDKIFAQTPLKLEKLKKEEKGFTRIAIEHCYICDFVGEKAGQSDHQNNHRLGLCNFCDRYVGHKHISQHRKGCSNAPEHILCCHLCDYRTTDRAHLKSHYNNKIHDDAKPKLICSMCNKTFRKEKRLNIHIRIHMKKVRVREDFKCTFTAECSYSSRRKSNFDRHLISHRTSKKDTPTIFNCKECSYTTKNSFNYNRHSQSCKSKNIKGKPIIISMIEPGTLCAINGGI